MAVLLATSCARQRDTTETPDETMQSLQSVREIYEAQTEISNIEDNLNQSHQTEPEQTDTTADSMRPEETQPITIQVIEPKEIVPRKADIEPTIKVQIIGDASSLTLLSDSEMKLGFGENAMQAKSHSRIQFKPRSARVSVRSYAVGIATFNADEYEEAIKVAEKWKREQYTVRLIKAGGPLVQADGTIADTTVYWVALGIFKDRQRAEIFKDKLFNRGISCWVIDESVLSPGGNIEILNERGITQAYANSLVRVESRSPIQVFDVPFGHGFWDSGHRENRRYFSPLEIIVDKKGKLGAINEVKLEEYVKGIVPVEIRINAHEEALKAQAVSARTESLAKLNIQHVFDPYDFCASQHCQEFGGLTRRTPRTDAAVDATRGEVLIYNCSLVDAVYSANCGGHTEHNEHVWSSRPNKTLRGVSDLYSNPESFDSPIPQSELDRWLKHTPRAYCADRRAGARNNFRWKVRCTANELSRIVNRHRIVGTIADIKILERGVSGRAKRIRIVGTRNTITINKELAIRKVLGGLKSSMFIVEIARDSSGNPQSFLFHGGGWGHGVGMCQAGAEGMALQGFKYPEILNHYFSGSEIKKLYE